MKKTLAASAALAMLVTPLAAMADDAPAVSANIGLFSKYKYRGQDQSDPAKAMLPAIQGGFDYSDGGFYVGNWNSSVGFLSGTEMDFYGGYRLSSGGIDYDFGALYYYYPGPDSVANTTELYASAGFGPVSVKYSTTISSKYFGLTGGKGTGYLEFNAKYAIGEGVALVGHFGMTQFSSKGKDNGGINYTDYKVGAEFDMGSGFTAGAALVGASKKGEIGDINKSRLVLSISKAM